MNFDNSTKSMDSINLSSLINHDNPKILYVYDFMKMWTFFVELIDEGELINKLKSNNISINRKVLADLAMNEPKKFEEIVKKVK